MIRAAPANLLFISRFLDPKLYRLCFYLLNHYFRYSSSHTYTMFLALRCFLSGRLGLQLVKHLLTGWK